MMNQMDHADILVVGAGLSGLMAANLLKAYGFKITVLDKSHSVGGRLATRRIGPGRADHGAQFFTVRTSEFHGWVDRWLAEGVVFQWSTGWSDGSVATTLADGYPRYAVRGGMNNLAKHLARGLDLGIEAEVTKIFPIDNGWQAEVQNGLTFTSRALLLTPPVPQALGLLAAGQTELTAQDEADLQAIQYDPSLTGLFWVEGLVNLPRPGAIQRPERPFCWIADNQAKGISLEARIITVQVSPRLSRQLWELPDQEALDHLKTGLEPYFVPGTKVRQAYLKRWQYATPSTVYPKRRFVAVNLPPLVFAGDAFGGPRIEGAALSGLAAGRALGELLFYQ
jgi:hypothetical protein